MNATATKASVKCWDACHQPATHVFTREGSNTLHACARHTRIDREEAESRGWTVRPVAQAEQNRPGVAQTLRLLDPNGYLVPGTITTVSSDDTANEIREQLLTETAPAHAAQWADFGYHPGDYRVA